MVQLVMLLLLLMRLLLRLLRLMVMVNVVVTGVPAAGGAADWCGMVEHILDVRAALEIHRPPTTSGSTHQGSLPFAAADADAPPLADGTERHGIRCNPLRRLVITGRTVLVRALGALVW